MHTDAFLIAVKLVSTFRRIFAEGAFNASFLPRFSKVLHIDGKDEADKLLADVFSAMLFATLFFSVLIILFFPQILTVVVSGFDVLSEKFGLTIVLGRICMPYLIFVSLTSLFAGVLNTNNDFALPAAAYSLLSVFMIVGMLLCHCVHMPSSSMVRVLAIFVMLSGITQSCILLRAIRKHGFSVSVRLHCVSPMVIDIMKHMIPGIIGAGVWQLNLLVDTAICSYLPTGTVTCINLADRLNQFPLGTLGIALSTALLPSLSKHVGQQNHEAICDELERGLIFALFFALFAAAVLTAMSVPTVAVAFQRGLFEEENVRVTASALVGFAIGLPAYILTKVFSALYFAHGDTMSPVLLGICSVFINLVCLIMVVPFWKYFGLALCTSISAMSNALLLIYFSRRRIRLKVTRRFMLTALSQICATLVAYFFLSKLASEFWTPEIGANLIKWPLYISFMLAAMLVYCGVLVLCLRLLKLPNWRL
jgi:putative peptidoglycan lipid II flippase